MTFGPRSYFCFYCYQQDSVMLHSLMSFTNLALENTEWVVFAPTVLAYIGRA